MKSRNPLRPKKIPYTILLDEELVKKVDEMLIKTSVFGFFSKSEIIRRGIILAYEERIKTPYRIVSPKQEKKMEKDTAWDIITPEDFALSIGALVLPTTDGRKVAFTSVSYNFADVHHHLVEELKEFNDPNNKKHWVIEESAPGNAKNPIEARVKNMFLGDFPGDAQNRQRVYTFYPIIFPGFENEHENEPGQPSNQASDGPAV